MTSENTLSGFCFAQITDLHLTSLADARCDDLFNKRILGYLSWLKRRRAEHQLSVLDSLTRDLAGTDSRHLVITGDLTHLGLPAEFQQARRWLQGVGSPAQVTVIPGNHETYVATPWEQTLALWTDYMAGDGSPSTGPDMFPSLRVRGPVAIIGLSSAVPSPVFMATGRIGPTQLERLETLLEETAARGLFRVLLVHQTPALGVDKFRKRLINGAALRKVLADKGVELVLHGHTHRPVWAAVDTPQGPVPAIGPPSASARTRNRERRARYHLYRLNLHDSGWSLDVEVRAYDNDDKGFHKETERTFQIASSRNP